MAVLLGAGVEMAKNASKIFIAEILTVKRRGIYLVLLDIFWSFGHLIIASIC